MSSSRKIDNRKKDILILGKGPPQGLKSTLSGTLLLKINTKFCLSLHCNGTNNYLFLNGKEIIKFKGKDSEIVPYALCLGNIYDFSTDYKIPLINLMY